VDCIASSLAINLKTKESPHIKDTAEFLMKTVGLREAAASQDWTQAVPVTEQSFGRILSHLLSYDCQVLILLDDKLLQLSLLYRLKTYGHGYN